VHKLEDMVNVTDKTCIYPGCKTLPTYNAADKTTPLYCSVHKLPDMVDVKHKTCLHPECTTRPTYNTEGETKGIYCSEHKLAGMVNVKSKTCIQAGCTTIPNFNTEGETKGIYCAKHKLADMVDVKNKTCIHPGCKTLPTYNAADKTTPLYCSVHKLAGMVNVKSKTCLHPGCKIQPAFNTAEKTKGIYCSVHKLAGMVDVKHSSCKSDWCFTRVQEKYEGYCLYCYMNLFPDKPVSRNYKTKEYVVVEFIKTTFPAFPWISDKIIQGGCSKRRPDLLLDLGYQLVIIEVDENQHTDYDCSCENKRIMELSQDIGHRPIVFIRFNPDDYDKNGKNITSCWGLNQTGICVVKKSKKDEWLQRLNALAEQVNYWTQSANETNKTVEIIQLFYDE
jgi:putative hemolysin